MVNDYKTLDEEQIKRLNEKEIYKHHIIRAASSRKGYIDIMYIDEDGDEMPDTIEKVSIEDMYYIMTGSNLSDEERRKIRRNEENKEVKKILEKCNSLKRMNKGNNVLVGRDEIIDLLEESLLKKRMKNTVLLGEAGTGKTKIIEEFASRIEDNYIVLELTMATAVAGSKYRGEFEEKLEKSLKEVINFNKTNTRKIILFIDEIHTIYKAGGAEGAIDASNIFKPYLSRGEITIIGATTLKEYNETIALDPALVRRLSPIKIDELDRKSVIQILQDFSENKVDKYFLEYIYDKTKNIKNYSNPDISIEILDRCMARASRLKIHMNNRIINEIVERFEKLELVASKA